MRHVLCVFLLVSCVGYAHAQVSLANAPFTIVITPFPAGGAAGHEVWVQLTIKNMTNEPLGLSYGSDDMTHADANFVIEVTYEFGNPVPKRKIPHHELASGHPVSRTVEPGATMTEQIPVSLSFDMSQPGKYTIQASGPITGEPNAVDVVSSNKIAVIVSAGTSK